MASLETIKKLDDIVFEIFQEYQIKTIDSQFKEEFPATSYLITIYDVSSNFIKNSITDCADTDNLFGIKILFRSQIEHFLRFKFICINWLRNKSDEPAKKYLAYSDAREELDKLKASVDEKKIYDSEFKIESWQVLLDNHPILKNYTKKEIQEETKKYTYKNIIRYLKNEIHTNKKPELSFWGSLIKEYSELSSFVHGGTHSYIEMSNLCDEKEREIEYRRLAGLSFQMSTSVKLFSTLLLSQTDKKKFNKYYLEIDAILDKFKNLE